MTLQALASNSDLCNFPYSNRKTELMGKHNFESANRYDVLVDEEAGNKTNTNVVKSRPSLLLDRRVEGRMPNDASDLLRSD